MKLFSIKLLTASPSTEKYEGFYLPDLIEMDLSTLFNNVDVFSLGIFMLPWKTGSSSLANLIILLSPRTLSNFRLLYGTSWRSYYRYSSPMH